MSLDPSYFEYPHRSYGMDHDRYDWSMLSERAPVRWPGGASVAVWINVAVEWFPLNQQGKPFPPPGGMTTAYPDLRHYTLRDYGNRVGLIRVLRALDAFALTPTFAVNAALCERVPALVERLAGRGNEIIGHGWHMDALLHGELSRAQEADLIGRSLETLRAHTGQPIEGWLSPARSQGSHTPELLAEHGVQYMGEWINDELPYPFRTASGPLVALPLSYELDDQFILHSNLHSETEYADQIIDAADFLLQEARASEAGRLLTINLHPWLVGQPHRIAQLERALAHLADTRGLWCAGAEEIVSYWQEQQS
ncbi:MAG: polysaccharide deacetylase family protein [Pseudomonadota bacterium]